jgi:hypothetical protein
VYVSVYERNPPVSGNTREALVFQALEGNDDECLRVMANAFESHDISMRQHFYFAKEELDFGDLSFGGKHTTKNMDEETMADLCLVM